MLKGTDFANQKLEGNWPGAFVGGPLLCLLVIKLTDYEILHIYIYISIINRSYPTKKDFVNQLKELWGTVKIDASMWVGG